MWQCSNKESSYQYRRCGRQGLDPWVGRFHGGGNGKPLQYSCLESPWTEEPDWLQSMSQTRLSTDTWFFIPLVLIVFIFRLVLKRKDGAIPLYP